MNSEDIARYVAGLEEALDAWVKRGETAEAEVERLRLADQVAAYWLRRAEEHAAEVERLRAALPVLPVAHARRSSYPGCGVTAALVGEEANSWWLSRDTAAKQVAIGLAVVREFDQMAAEAADTSSDDEHAAVADIAFPMQVLDAGRSWVKGVVLADSEGPEAVDLAQWFADAANAHRAARTSEEAGQ